MNDYQFMQYANTEVDGARGYFQEFAHLENQAQVLEEKINKPLKRRIDRMLAISVMPILVIWALVQGIVTGFGSSGSQQPLMRVLNMLFLSVSLIYALIVLFKREWSWAYLLRRKMFLPKLELILGRQGGVMQAYEEYLSHCHYLSRVPSQYAYPEALNKMLYYFQSMRVQTVTEAINLFETEMHQLRMEMSQQEMLDLQVQTHHEAKQASRNSGIAAAFSVASYFSK